MLVPSCRVRGYTWCWMLWIAVALSWVCFHVEACPPSVSVSATLIQESELIQGRSITLSIACDTWKTPITAGVASLLTSGFSGSSTNDTAFQQRRSFLLVPESFALSGTTDLIVTFQADALYDIASSETITFSAVAGTLTSGLPSSDSAAITVDPSAAAIISPRLSFGESVIRAGSSLTLRLAAGERWADVSGVTTAGNATTPQWDVWSSAIIDPASSYSVSLPSDFRIALIAAPAFDASVTEAVTFNIPAAAVESGLIPTHSDYIFLVVVPERGVFYLNSPVAVQERSLSLGDPAASINIYLNVGETWKDSITAAEIRACLSSPTTTANGFNAHKDEIIITSPTLDATQQVLTVYFNVSASFDVSAVEDVAFAPSASLVASELLPLLSQSSAHTNTFQITPSAGTIPRAIFSITEFQLDQGGALSITVTGGERFVPLAPAAYVGVMSGSSSESNGFNNKKSALLLQPSSFALSNGNTTLTITFATGSGYDISSRETITMQLQASFFASNILPINATITIEVLPSAAVVQITHSTKSVKPFVFTEAEIINGGGTFFLNWSSQEQWVCANFSVSNITAMQAVQEANGWTARRGSIVQFECNASSPRLLKIVLRPCATYDITAQEVIRVTIPTSAILSGLPSADGTEWFEFRINPSGGNVSLACCTFVAQESIMNGSAFLVIRLAEGETWSAPVSTLWADAFTSTTPSASNGWVASYRTVLKPSSFVIANLSRDMVVLFNAAPLYSMNTAQEVVVISLAPPTLPYTIVASSFPLTPSQLLFTVTRSRTIVNMTVFGEVTEERLRSGYLRIRFIVKNDEWAQGTEQLLTNSFFGNVSGPVDGFNASRGAIFAGAVVRIPAPRQGAAVVVILSPAPQYSIHAPELVSVSLAPGVFASVSETAVMTFVVKPSRGNVSISTGLVFSEEQIRTTGAIVPISLAPVEAWVDPSDTRFPSALFAQSVNVSTTVASPYGSQTMRSSLFSNFSRSGSTLLLVIPPTPSFDVTFPENITFLVLGAMVQSGLAPSGLCSFQIVTSPVKISGGPFSVQEDDVRSGVTALYNVTLYGDTFVDSDVLRTACIVALHGNISVVSSNKKDEFYVRRNLGALVSPNNNSFAFEPTYRVLSIRVRQMELFEIASVVSVRFFVPSKCIRSGQKPTQRVTITITSSRANLTMFPASVKERDFRSGSVSVVALLSRNEAFSTRYLATFKLYLSSSLTPIASPYGFAGHFHTLVDPLQPLCGEAHSAANGEYCLLNSTALRIRFPTDAYFDVSQSEQINFAFSATTSMVNSTLPPRIVSAVTVLPEPGECAVGPQGVTFVEYDVRGGPPHVRNRFRAWRFNLTLAVGETFVDTASAKVAILNNAYAVNPSAGAAPFGSLKLVIFPTTEWVLSANKRTWTIPLTPDGAYSIDVAEEVHFVIPSTAVASGLAPNSTAAIVRITADEAPNAFALPTFFSEMDLRTGPVSLTVYVVGPGNRNDTWVSTVGVVFATAANCNCSNVLVSTASPAFAIDRNVLNITIPRMPLFDIAAQESVEIRVPAVDLFSRLVPNSTIAFTVDCVPGNAYIPTVKVIDEVSISLSSTPAASVTISLIGETFVPSSATAQMFAETCVADPYPSSIQTTWSQRRRFIIVPGNITFPNNNSMHVPLLKDEQYDIGAAEVITCRVNRSMVASGLEPNLLNGSLSFRIVPAVTTESVSVAVVPDSLIRSGVNITLQLNDGDAWNSNMTGLVEALRARLNTSAPEFTSKIRGALTAVSYLDAHRLLLSFGPAPTFATTYNVSVFVCAEGMAIRSLAAPDCSAAVFSVVSQGGQLYPIVSNVSVLQMKRGGRISFGILSDLWKGGECIRFAPQDTAPPYGFAARQSFLYSNATNVELSADRTVLYIHFNEDFDYAIDVSERVDVIFNMGCTESGFMPTGVAFFTVLLPAISVNSSRVLTGDMIRSGGHEIIFTIRQGEFYLPQSDQELEDVFRIGFVAATTSPISDPYSRGIQNYIPLVFGNASITVHRNWVRVRLVAAPEYNPCTTNETFSMSVPSAVIAGWTTPTDPTFAFVISSPPYVIGLRHGTVSNLTRFTVTEFDIRSGGVRFNLTVSHGKFTIYQPLVNLFTGTLSCSSCFAGRSGSILPTNALSIGRELMVRFASDLDYNIPQNEEVFIDIPADETECTASVKHRLSIVILGTKPKLRSFLLSSAKIVVGHVLTASVVGDELSLFDSINVVAFGMPCNHTAIATVNPSFWRSPLALFRGSMNFSITFPHVTAEYMLCYHFSGATSDFPLFPYRGETRVSVISRVHKYTGIEAGEIGPGMQATFGFDGDGLDSRPGGDFVCLLNVYESSKNVTCNDINSITKVVTVELCSDNLDGDVSLASHVSLTTNAVQSAGFFLWCYRLFGSHVWSTVGRLEVKPTVSSVTPRSVEPMMSSSEGLVIHGFAFDTRPKVSRGNSLFVVNHTNCSVPNAFYYASVDLNPGDVRNSTEIHVQLPPNLRPTTLYFCYTFYPRRTPMLLEATVTVMSRVDRIISLSTPGQLLRHRWTRGYFDDGRHRVSHCRPLFYCSSISVAQLFGCEFDF